MTDKVDTSNEACAVACMLISNPQGSMRKDGDGWQKRVNDLIRALRDERNELLEALKIAQEYVDIVCYGEEITARQAEIEEHLKQIKAAIAKAEPKP